MGKLGIVARKALCCCFMGESWWIYLKTDTEPEGKEFEDSGGEKDYCWK